MFWQESMQKSYLGIKMLLKQRFVTYLSDQLPVSVAMQQICYQPSPVYMIQSSTFLLLNEFWKDTEIHNLRYEIRLDVQK